MAMKGQGSVWHQYVITINNKGRGCHYITDDVKSKIAKELSTIMIGTLHLFIKHTSASIMLNESWDSSVKDDMEMMLNRWAPENLNYQHSCEGPDDMPAHAKHALMGSSVTIPITDGKLNLGTWQGIWMAEHRNGKRTRDIVATIHGCSK